MSNRELNTYYRLYSGRKRLTISEKEDILGRLIAENAEGKEVSPVSGVWSHILTRVALAAVILLLAVPVVVIVAGRHKATTDYIMRGEDSASIMTIQCMKDSRTTSDVCSRGDTLAFKAYPIEERYYFAAFARNNENKKVVWYFPADESGTSISLKKHSIEGVLSEAILIGEEHHDGEYTVFGIFSAKPAKRSEIRKIFDDEEAWAEYTIVETTLVIEE